MRRTTLAFCATATAALTTAALLTVPANAAPAAPTTTPGTTPAAVGTDNLPNPLADKRNALRTEGLTEVLNGTAVPVQQGASTVVQVGSKAKPAARSKNGQVSAAKSAPQYVELSRQTTDRIFVVLADFGDTRHPDYPDQDTNATIPGPARFDGPLNNQIPAPDRTNDNSTNWQPNYDRAYYQNLYFGKGGAPGSGGAVESVRQWYERQSSGRYSVDGTVTDWVKVKYNEARYGRSNGYPCAGNVCSNTWNLVQDAVNQWYANQRAAGRTTAQINADLKSFDQWDRYDFDADGNFNEPDGYIDHFQIVHAGGDQADGDPWQGEDAIWSHRWYVQSTPIGSGGPTGNPLGGTKIGNSPLWVGDYTIQPENGGVSVFTHEYGHDLGLPDLYDTNGGDNGIDFWSMMAQSRVSGPKDQAIGSRGADFGAWEKLFLGWLDYATVLGTDDSKINLGPHEYNNADPQALVVVLPKKNVTTTLRTPAAGTKDWWSGAGDDLNTSMARNVTLAAGTSTLTMKANWDIEDCGADPCDYAYVEVNDGGNWVAIPGSITKADEGNGIDGTSAGWVPATFDLSAYAGKTVGLRLHYQTDGAAGGLGFFADDITVVSGGTTLFTSGAEGASEGWTLDGFSAIGASFTKAYDNYYIASYRAYLSFDKYLQSGPYNFGWANSRPDWVEHYALQNGLLIFYWDTSQADNNTSQHPGSGLILPIDANPKAMANLSGGYWRGRVSSYDATFGLEASESFTLHLNGQANYIRGNPAVRTFNDGKSYWDSRVPTYSVKVPNNGINITVTAQTASTMTVRVHHRA